jgi:hypothetical protein
MVEVGARVVVESEKVGVKPRSGVVTAVHGSAVEIRWDNGHTTSFTPAAGSMKVVSEEREGNRRT